MSRLYNMSLEVTGFKMPNAKKIMAAAKKEWPFDDFMFNEDTGRITGSGDANLCGGESEDEFANRLTRAIFKANGSPCKVVINATYLEDLPFETFEFDEKHLPK